MAAAYFVLLAALGGTHAWDRLGVPAKGLPSFFDLRSVTSAWECDRKGIAVLASNPCDPARRPANYPRLWLLPSHLGLGQSSTVPLGIAVALVFLAAAVLVLPRDASLGEAAVYALALCSPAVMLGVARGNVDLLLFALLAAALLASRHSAAPGILLASLLKLFPIAAAGVLARRRAWRAFAAVLTLFALYVLWIRSDVETIRRVTPQADSYSFGVHVLGMWLGGNVLWDVLLLGLALLAAFLVHTRLHWPAGEASERDLDLFWAGAGIYLASYALFRSFDYRLAFLLLTVPLLLQWGGRLAWVTLGTLLATLWLGTPWSGIPAVGRIVEHGSPWLGAVPQLVLFAFLAAGLAATVPVQGGERRSA